MTKAAASAPASVKKSSSDKKSDKKVERDRFAAIKAWLEKHKKASIFLWALGLAAWVGAVLFCVQWLFVLIFRATIPYDVLASNWFSAVYSFVVYAVSFVIIIAVPWRLLKNGTSRDELGLRGLPTWTDVLLAPVGLGASLLVAGALTALLMAILPNIDWQQTQEVGFHGLYAISDYFIAFVCLVVLAPIAEEIVFRGWLYGKLRMRLSAIPAILITSVLFGIMHGQMNVGVVVFAMSIVMCLSRELTGTIWAGVLIHMLKNGIAFYFLFRM